MHRGMYCVERQNSLSSRCPQKRWVLIFLFSSWRHTLNICSSQSTLQMQASLSMSILKTINWSAPEMKVTNVLGWGSRGKKWKEEWKSRISGCYHYLYLRRVISSSICFKRRAFSWWWNFCVPFGHFFPHLKTAKDEHKGKNLPHWV